MAGTLIDFELPWARLPGEPRDGFPKLNRQNFFLLACREAFQKGSVLPDEEVFLTSLQKSLGLSKKEAQGFARLAKQEAQQGKISNPSGLDAKDLFRKGCAFAEAKGKPLKEERQLLSGYSEALGVQMMRGDSTLRQLAVKMARPVTEERPKIGLKRDANLDGSVTAWGDGEAISDESLAGLNVMATSPAGGRPSLGPPRTGAAPRRVRRSPAPLPETSPDQDFRERRSAFFHLMAYLVLGTGASYHLHSTWKAPEAASLPGMLLGLMILALALVKAPGWLLRLLRPV